MFRKVRTTGKVGAAYYGYSNGLWWVRLHTHRRHITFWYPDGHKAAQVFYSAMGLLKGS